MSSSLLLLPAPLDISSLEGVMEGVPHDAFSGWIWNMAHPGAEIAVEVVGPGFYARLQANESRFDLADAGKRGGNCWFKILVPDAMPAEARAATFALLAGTPHRLRGTAEGSLQLDADWLDTQPVALHAVVNAQRIRVGLSLPPLSREQLGGFVDHAVKHGFDLSQLTKAVASVP